LEDFKISEGNGLAEQKLAQKEIELRILYSIIKNQENFDDI
jgi:hypothetical protein